MAKGYWIVHVTVTDPETYKQYVAANAAAFERFGGRFVVRGGRHEVLRGTARPRHVVIEFASYDQALACYHSPEYAAAKAIFDRCAVSDLIVIEGTD